MKIKYIEHVVITYKMKGETIQNKKNCKYNSSDDNSDYTSDVSEGEIDVHEYRKFISKIFPSKHINNKIKAGNRIKKLNKKENKNKKNNSKSDYDDDDTETLDDEDTDTSYEDEDDEDDEDDEEEEEYDDEDDEDEQPRRRKAIDKEKKDNNKGLSIVTRSKSKKSSRVVKELPKKKGSSSDNKKSNKKQNNKKKNKKKVVESDSSDDDEDEDIYEDDDEEGDDDDMISPKSNKVNIIFTIGGAEDEYEDDDDDYEDDYSDDYETEDENASVSSVESTPKKKKIIKKSSKSKKDQDKDPEDKDKEQDKDKDSSKKKSKDDDDKKESNEKTLGSMKKSSSFKDRLNNLSKLLDDNKDKNKDHLIEKCIAICEEDIKHSEEKKNKKVKKEKDRNLRIFKKIISDKNVMNDFTFYEKLDVEQQKKVLKELREINKLTRIEKPYRMCILESDIPTVFKGAAMKKINTLRQMDPGSGEFYKVKNWVDTFMRIPFGKHQQLDVSITKGVDSCHEFMEKAQGTLNEAIYGLNDAKMQIMQMLGQFVTNPTSIGGAIAIHGPPGTGKTSLVKEGISKILNRPFAFIALGGATDSSFLEGHSYTYEGSTWGKIVQILIDSKCMNPVIYFDELDKISDTPKGEEITGILTHLTDTTQNTQFHDKYFSEIDFDLSKCMFIFSYNDESKINPILKDRMYRTQTKGYNLKEKTTIGKDYLLPKIRKQLVFEDADVIIPDETLQHVIDNLCDKEQGVRNLKRCLEIIYTKLNLYRLMKPGVNLFEENMSLKVEFPFTVTKEIAEKLITRKDNNMSSLYGLYI